MSRILIVDDDQNLGELIATGLAGKAREVHYRNRGIDALELFRATEFDVVLADLNLAPDDIGGLDLCARITENRPGVPVIVITGFGNLEAAVAAIRAGAYDFINKPFDMQALRLIVDRALQHRHLKAEVKRLSEERDHGHTVGQLVGESAPMRRLYDLIRRLASTDGSVLISGESGTGKELVARALHVQGSRAEGPFVAINCTAVPANLLESELFGHVKGAFTDAKANREGLFEQATNGTLLLDEIGEMPADMQPKLLRVLQERRARRVGSNTEVSFDTRVIAATNRDLEAEVEEGRFREDLYYRLNVVEIAVPPLRARGNDILLLAQHFVERFAARFGKEVKGISSEAAKKLLEYEWPGNVRQLENSMERAVTLTRFDQITIDDLPERIQRYETSRVDPADVDVEHMLTLEQLERRYIERMLKAVGNNKTRAAKALGLDRRTLYRKLERYQDRTERPVRES